MVCEKLEASNLWVYQYSIFEYTHTILQNLQKFKPDLPKTVFFVDYADKYVNKFM